MMYNVVCGSCQICFDFLQTCNLIYTGSLTPMDTGRTFVYSNNTCINLEKWIKVFGFLVNDNLYLKQWVALEQ